MKIYLYTKDRSLLGYGKVKTNFKSYTDGFKIEFYLKNPISISIEGTLAYFEIWNKNDLIYRGKPTKLYFEREGINMYCEDTISGLDFNIYCENLNEEVSTIQ